MVTVLKENCDHESQSSYQFRHHQQTHIDDAHFFSDLKTTSITKETHREHEQTRSAKGRSQKKFGSGAPRPPSNPHDDLTARSIRELLSVRN